MIFDAFDSGAARAGRTAKIIFFGFDPVADYPASAVGADWRELMDRALETIERVTVSARCKHFKSQIIVVSANIALCHRIFLPLISKHAPKHASKRVINRY
jgi:hypothetical protein